MRRGCRRRLHVHAGGRRRGAVLGKPRPGEWVGGISGLVLLVATFLPWYSAGGERATAWQAFGVTDIVLAVAAVLGLSVAACVLFRVSVSYPVAGASVAAGFGLVAVVLILIRMIDHPGAGQSSLEFGAWLGLASAVGVAIGGYLGMQPMTEARPASAG